MQKMIDKETRKILSETYWIPASEPVKPDTSNEFKFNGTLEEFKKYLPELYEKIMKERKSDE